MKQIQKKRARKVRPQPAAHRYFSWKWLVGTSVGATAIIGLILAVEKVHPIIEPWWYADRKYVRDHTSETVTKKTEPISKWMGDYESFRIEQTMEITKLNLNTLNQNLLLAKKEAETAPNSQVVRDAVAALTKQVADTRKRIEEYESALFIKRSGR